MTDRKDGRYATFEIWPWEARQGDLVVVGGSTVGLRQVDVQEDSDDVKHIYSSAEAQPEQPLLVADQRLTYIFRTEDGQLFTKRATQQFTVEREVQVAFRAG